MKTRKFVPAAQRRRLEKGRVMMMSDMTQLLHSMENTIKLQTRAGAERRARKAEREEKEFLEKLKQAAASKVELDGRAAKVKGAEAAAQRDQLIGLMML